MPDQDEGNSFFKWLVALGLPLILLALFVFHQQTKDAANSRPQTTISPLNDSGVATTVRQAIRDSSSLSDQAKTVTVDSSEGVVTLRGSVASLEEKALIERIAKNTNGVTQVKNEIEVR